MPLNNILRWYHSIREMAQYLRVLAAFPQDPMSILHGGLQPSVIPIPEDLIPFSDFLWAPDMFVVHRHICKQNNPRHKIKINIFKGGSGPLPFNFHKELTLVSSSKSFFYTLLSWEDLTYFTCGFLHIGY